MAKKGLHMKRQGMINFTKKYPLIKNQRLTKGKEKGRLFILSGWHKEGIEEPWSQKVFPSISFLLFLGIFLGFTVTLMIRPKTLLRKLA